jgi:hypothetical protein
MTNQVPAYLLNRGASAVVDDNDFIGGIGAALPPHLSIADNRFTLVDAAGNERLIQTLYIDVCIIAANDKTSRMYFDPATPFNKMDTVPPLCWSDNGTGPSRNAMRPQAPSCSVCPFSAWNSAVSRVTGRGIPACQTSKKIAFVVPGDADDIVYMLKIPPASLGNLVTFHKTLGANTIGGRKAAPPDVITRIEFESQGILKFTPVRMVDEDTFNRTERAYANPSALATITGRDDIAIDPSLPLPNGAQARPMISQHPGMVPPPKPAVAWEPPTNQHLPLQGQQPAMQAAKPPQPVWDGTKWVLPAELATVQNAPPAPPQPVWDGTKWVLLGAPTPAAEPPKRSRGRPKAQETAPSLPAQGQVIPPSTNGAAPVDGLDLPDFLKRPPDEAPAAAPSQVQFGIEQNAPPPPDEVSNALTAAFNLKPPQ